MTDRTPTPARPEDRARPLTDRQLRGVACILCGDEPSAVVPSWTSPLLVRCAPGYGCTLPDDLVDVLDRLAKLDAMQCGYTPVVAAR